MDNIVSQKFILSLLLGSLVLMLVLSQPRSVDWNSYESGWSWVMGITGLLGMIIIVWQVLFGIRAGGLMKNLNTAWVNKVYRYLGWGTVLALLFHPFAAMIAYGTSFIDIFQLDFSSTHAARVSVGKIVFDCLLVGGILYSISKKILSFDGRLWVHMLLYPLFGAIWGHARVTGSMIAQLPGVKEYWIVLGVILLCASSLKIYYEIIYYTVHNQEVPRTVFHFSPLVYRKF